MIKIYKKICGIFFKIFNRIIPNPNLALREIQKFVEKIVRDISYNTKISILDAGAGNKRFEHYFNKFDNYDTCDLKNDSFHKKIEHTFYCDIQNIPVENEKYDVVINLQVLEHVKYPEKCIKELSRILKKDGKIYISAPSMYPYHFAPDNYYNFHPSAFKLILEKYNLKILNITEQGGAFLVIGVILSKLPFSVLKNQKNQFTKILFFLFFLLTIPIFHFIFPLTFKFLDKFFKTEGITIGYNIVAQKLV
tara:strand:- start:270 stop:1019 length:750 start_codon:yes stop_codon:yes gene_type:complete